jgi:transposase
MGDLFLLSEQQMARISPYCRALTIGRVVSGIVYVIRNGLPWKDAPKGYGPHKTLYNRFIRWSRLGVFDHIFASRAAYDFIAQPDWDALRRSPCLRGFREDRIGRSGPAFFDQATFGSPNELSRAPQGGFVL